jgi:hypothetical protein
MNVLLLIVGLVFGITGVFLYIRHARKKYGLVCIISGVSLICFYFIAFILDVKVWIIFQIVLIGIILAIANHSTTIKDSKPISKKTSKGQNYILNWHILPSLTIPFVFFLFFPMELPAVKMGNGVIHMSGVFGGDFLVSNIQSVDTVNFYSKPTFKIFGMWGFGLKIGDFKLRDEKNNVKLNIKKNNPPYIKIKMNDNRLFLLNFEKPDETVEFYNQLKNELSTN